MGIIKKSLIMIYIFGLLILISCNKPGTKPASNTAPQTVSDTDGNVYHIVTIGTQVWMAENLKTTKYRDGTPITNVTAATWSTLTTEAYCDYQNNPSNSAIYGRLYNWYAATDNNICPKGWHVASDADWTTLTNFLGDTSTDGGKLKETGTSHWLSPNTGATNETGFTALPGGYRGDGGAFVGMGTNGGWWTTTASSSTNAWYRWMYNNLSAINKFNVYKAVGFSIHCVKD